MTTSVTIIFKRNNSTIYKLDQWLQNLKESNLGKIYYLYKKSKDFLVGLNDFFLNEPEKKI